MLSIFAFVMLIVLTILLIWFDVQQAKAEQILNKEQKYIVRFGEIVSETEIITEDGNVWLGEDFPEERYVRILFDSNETKNVKDDIIIDITDDTREIERR